MKTLMLLRHATADSAAPADDDHDRPLSAGGRDEAARLGRHLAAHEKLPSLVLCSSARRAMETAEQIASSLALEPRVQIERALYLAGPAAMLDEIAGVSDVEACILLVAHNPGIHALAVRLAQSGDGGHRERMASQFPAAAMADLVLPISCWSDVQRGGRLDDFLRPIDLGD